MIKILLFIFALPFTSSKEIPLVKAGINTTFDYNYNEFNFDYKGPGNDMILMYINIEEGNFDLKLNCILNAFDGTFHKGDYILTKQIFYGHSLCYIRFNSSEGNKEAKGSFVIYNYNKELSIKLKNKYGNADLSTYHVAEPGYLDISDQLNFSVPNLERNATVIFKYNTKNQMYDEYTIKNPFKICHYHNCQENISSYDFKKGESYKIIVKMTRIKDEHYESGEVILIPGFTFYDQNYNGTFSPDDIIDDEDDDGDEGDENGSNDLKIKLLFLSLIIILL